VLRLSGQESGLFEDAIDAGRAAGDDVRANASKHP
jgi:hypothetical protein